MRAALYVRVSTEEQAQEGQSIAAQLKALREYAAGHGLAVAAEFVDEGASARTSDRPQFQRMIALARQQPRPFDVILVHKTDRFARNREDAVVYKSLLRRECGMEVIAILEPFDDSPTGRLLEGILEVMAEFYSLNLAQEVLKGQRERARQGRSVGPAPIGYAKGPDGRYQPDPATAPLVRWLYATYAAGESGLRLLAAELEREGPGRFGPAAARYRWTPAFVRRILTNPVYTGTYTWFVRDASAGRRARDPSEWVVVENAHPPLVDRETFARVGQLLQSRHGVRRTVAADYLLRGLVRCLDCGGSMIRYACQWQSRGGRRVVPSLLCSAYSHHRRCYRNLVPMAAVEAAVLDRLGVILRAAVRPEQVAAAPQPAAAGGGERDRLQRQLAALAQRQQRLLAAYELGALTLAELQARRDRLLAEQQQVLAQQARLPAPAPPAAADLQAAVRTRLAAILAAATDPDLPLGARRQALAAVVRQVACSRRAGLIRITLQI